VIVLDTTVLVYAVGGEHELRDSCRRLVDAVGGGVLAATTSVEVIQEFVHVRARRRDRADAASLGRAWTALLSPLLVVSREDVEVGLGLFERHRELGAFGAVLAAATLAAGASALVSSDAAFSAVAGLRVVRPATSAIDDLLDVPGSRG
jgi:predicted nucleic acid-binding protein